jgi:hypothetical protein
MVTPPETFRIGRGRRQTEYVRADDLVGKPRNQISSDDELVVSSEQLDCAVVRDTSDRLVDYSQPGSPRPVYRIGKTNEVAIPTGRLFVRLPKHNTLESNTEILEGFGMRVDSQNSWAPHTGWVIPTSGNIAEAISQVEAVAERLGARVEPELVSLRAKRTSTPR